MMVYLINQIYMMVLHYQDDDDDDLRTESDPAIRILLSDLIDKSNDVSE